MTEIETAYQRVTSKPRDYLEAVERAARRLVQARRRSDELAARAELARALESRQA